MTLDPTLRPAKTRQDYGTDPLLIAAVEKRFGPIVCDLAARADNAKCATFITPDENSLTVPWAERFPTGLLWLNPEFAQIAPWAKKCALEAKHRHGLIALLTPASVGADWFARYVRRFAFVMPLMSRVTFEGEEHAYPRDCMLSVYGFGFRGFHPWWWKAVPGDAPEDA